eukprot:scaffold87938_cov66-Phaeocystis_antarctica.AAC.2
MLVSAPVLHQRGFIHEVLCTPEGAADETPRCSPSGAELDIFPGPWPRTARPRTARPRAAWPSAGRRRASRRASRRRRAALLPPLGHLLKALEQQRAHRLTRAALGRTPCVRGGGELQVRAQCGDLGLSRLGKDVRAAVAGAHARRDLEVARRDGEDRQLVAACVPRRRQRPVERQVLGRRVGVKVLGNAGLGEGVARQAARARRRAVRQPEVLDELGRREQVGLCRDEGELAWYRVAGRDEGERAGEARAEQRAAQRQRHHVLGALVVARSPYIGDDEHRVRLGHHAAEHAVARRVVVMQAWRVEQPDAAGAQRARRADGKRAAQGYAPHERPQRAVVCLVGRVHVRPGALPELRRVLGAQLEALAELLGHGGVRHEEVHRALQRHAAAVDRRGSRVGDVAGVRLGWRLARAGARRRRTRHLDRRAPLVGRHQLHAGALDAQQRVEQRRLAGARVARDDDGEGRARRRLGQHLHVARGAGRRQRGRRREVLGVQLGELALRVVWREAWRKAEPLLGRERAERIAVEPQLGAAQRGVAAQPLPQPARHLLGAHREHRRGGGSAPERRGRLPAPERQPQLAHAEEERRLRRRHRAAEQRHRELGVAHREQHLQLGDLLVDHRRLGRLALLQGQVRAHPGDQRRAARRQLLVLARRRSGGRRAGGRRRCLQRCACWVEGGGGERGRRRGGLGLPLGGAVGGGSARAQRGEQRDVGVALDDGLVLGRRRDLVGDLLELAQRHELRVALRLCRLGVTQLRDGCATRGILGDRNAALHSRGLAA